MHPIVELGAQGSETFPEGFEDSAEAWDIMQTVSGEAPSSCPIS